MFKLVLKIASYKIFCQLSMSGQDGKTIKIEIRGDGTSIGSSLVF